MDLFTFADKSARLRNAENLRDQGIERVSRGKWMQAALDTFEAHRGELPDRFIGEDIREMILRHMEAPHHANAWGGVHRLSGEVEADRRDGPHREDEVAHIPRPAVARIHTHRLIGCPKNDADAC